MNDTFYIIPRIGGIAYLNISKAACSSILIALSRMRSEEKYTPPRMLLDDGSEPIHGFVPAHGHIENFFCRWPLQYSPIPKDIITFSFVRNPYNRFYSFFTSKIVGRQAPADYYKKFGITEGCQFAECVRIITSIDPDDLEHHAIPQTKLIYREGELRAKFIGKVETLSTDWEVIKKLTGFDRDLERANVSKKQRKEVYDTESRDRIYQYYKDDFELFDYDKDSVNIDKEQEYNNINDIYTLHLIPQKELKDIKEKIQYNKKSVVEKSELFEFSPEERHKYFTNQTEVFNELNQKRTHALNNKINEFKKTIDRKDYESRINRLLLRIGVLEGENKDVIQSLSQQKQSLNEKQTQINLQKKELSNIRKTLNSQILTNYAKARKKVILMLWRIYKYRIINEAKILNSNGLVDAHYYFSRYPDTIGSGMSAAEHYTKFGAQEGRDPSKNFNTLTYLTEHPEVVIDGCNPLLHYSLSKK